MPATNHCQLQFSGGLMRETTDICNEYAGTKFYLNQRELSCYDYVRHYSSQSGINSQSQEMKRHLDSLIEQRPQYGKSTFDLLFGGVGFSPLNKSSTGENNKIYTTDISVCLPKIIYNKKKHSIGAKAGYMNFEGAMASLGVLYEMALFTWTHSDDKSVHSWYLPNGSGISWKSEITAGISNEPAGIAASGLLIRLWMLELQINADMAYHKNFLAGVGVFGGLRFLF